VSSTTARAMLVDGPSGAFRRGTVDRREPGPRDVAVDIAYAGICHSDIHQARQEWGPSIFPMVPGHEITGTVAAVGAEVTTFAVGDRVGVGVLVDSCRECRNCLAGNEQYCQRGAVETYNARDYDGNVTYGGYSSSIVVDEHFVLSIPDSLGLDVAAPLLCAGITVYSPLSHWGAGPGVRVGIVGMGGLGHMGVQIAAAMGAEVTVLSHSLSKLDDGLRFGAAHFHATSDPATFDTLANSFDLIVNTVSDNLDIDALLSLVDLDGALVHVGIPEKPDTYSAGTLIGMRRSMAGSNIGGLAETQEMLDFCGEHGFGAQIETITAADIDGAYDRVVASQARYRVVIDAATL
jgi:uncharacterized zinc-type alcohol dehydrogenase-like protein